MNQPFSYLQPTQISESLFKDRGSKFIGFCYPVKSEEDVKQALEEIKSKHPQARHLCYAYMYGPNGEFYRANDDGEPSNSAGMPILNQIKSSNLTNTFIGVIRYFGGTKLGVPGLINAYKTAAEEAIEVNKIEEHHVHAYYRVQFEYAQMDAIMHLAKVKNWNILHQKFELDCELEIELQLDQQEAFKNAFNPYPEVNVKHIKNA